MLAKNFKKIVLVFLAVLSLSSFVKYNSLLSEKEKKIEQNAKKINAILSENFKQVEKIIVVTGRKIAEDNPHLNPKLTYKIFRETLDASSLNNIFSWSLLDWVDVDGYETVSTINGIVKNPQRIGLERNYIRRGGELWKIIFSEPAIGIPSEVYIIPVGVPIESKNHSLAGVVAAGIDIKKLTNVIEANLDPQICFMVIDRRNSKFVFGSYDSEKYQGQTFNKLPKSIDAKNYIYKKDMEVKFPYEIWVGYDEEQFWNEILYSSLLFALQIIGVAALVVIVKNNGNKP